MLKVFVKVLFVVVAAFAVLASSEASAQGYPPQQPAEAIDLSGPRVGVTMLSDGVRNQLNRDFDAAIGPVITQFGWQKERRFLSSPDGITGVTEFVFLVGGVEQGVALPSLTWLIGLRTIKGVEFAAGPNVTPAGFGFAAAGGMTFRAGNLNIPINLAAVPSKSGVRVSLLAGFNSRRR
jgi:hypothetical protein